MGAAHFSCSSSGRDEVMTRNRAVGTLPPAMQSDSLSLSLLTFYPISPRKREHTFSNVIRVLTAGLRQLLASCVKQ